VCSNNSVRNNTPDSPYLAAFEALVGLGAIAYGAAKVVRVVRAIRGEECPGCDRVVQVLDAVYNVCPECRHELLGDA
jgi:hypothetical protein